jgi:hypothetical protein
MVTSIVPGAGADTRYARPAPQAPARRGDEGGDSVELASASISAARDSVREGLMQVRQALSLGQDAQAMLVQVQALVRSRGTQADLDALLADYRQRVEAVLADGVGAAAGDDISIRAEPDGAPISLAGVDLRLGQDEGAVNLGASPRVDAASLAQTAQRSLETVQDAMSRLLESARGLEAHQGFLGAAAGAAGARHDLEADSARLLALHLRQALEGAVSPIANVEPRGVLSLFRG